METISLKIKSLEKRQDTQDKINNDIFVRLDGKVSYKHFYWIIGILITMLITFLGYIASGVSELRADMNQVKNDQNQVKNQVSYMNGVFKSNDFKSQ